MSEALYYLREREAIAESLWIDALCINQRDGVEDSRDVQKMGTIFGAVRDVVTRLGPENNTTVRAMQALSRSK